MVLYFTLLIVYQLLFLMICNVLNTITTTVTIIMKCYFQHYSIYPTWKTNHLQTFYVKQYYTLKNTIFKSLIFLKAQSQISNEFNTSHINLITINYFTTRTLLHGAVANDLFYYVELLLKDRFSRTVYNKDY